MQLPHEFFKGVVEFELPPPGRYGVAVCFLPTDPVRRAKLEEMLELNVRIEGQRVLGWRDVPIDEEHVGTTANACRPVIRQLFVEAGAGFEADQDAFERKLYVIRRICELAAGPDMYIATFSSKTVVYKGMLISHQLRGFYPDLADERIKSALALVHSRFSTNTFPSWELAHPYRVVCHNGEINTLMGNVNWMRARESQLESPLFGIDIQKVQPVVRPGGSDSATFDNVLELLMLAGRDLPHAVMMMIPEAYVGRDDLSDEIKAFYAFHSCLMEPWDGPASIAFTDGRFIGATLDRNGLRPGRWVLTDDGHVLLGSETGLLDVAPESVVKLGRLQPGKLFLVDLEKGRIVEDAEVKHEIATRKPYGEWLERNIVQFSDLPVAEPRVERTEPLLHRQLAFGYSQEDIRVLLTPTARMGEEPIGSMGNDNALAVLSDQAPALNSYFKQLFAQVTNPPIDSIREAVVMSLSTAVGAEGNLLDESPEHAHQLVMEQPILRNQELETLRQVSHDIFRAHTIDITWPVAEGVDGMRAALARICDEAHDCISAGVNVIIVSDRNLGADRAAIPSLLAVAAVHHHLVREGTRLRAGLVLESGEPREVHHMATLIGYGASAINPYLMFETVDDLAERGLLTEDIDADKAQQHLVKAIGKGLLKTISKMGISTIQSYCGAQIFEAVGLEKALIDRHFTGTASRIGGVGLEVLAQEALDRHSRAYPFPREELLPVGGVYAWRRDGERHMWNPETISLMQHAVRNGNGDAAAKWKEYSRMVDEEATRAGALRGLLKIRADQEPIPLEEVEPAKEIVKRFATGAMSLGSISTEAHETLAIAMNRLGGRSNTGEGGEDPRRFERDENGDWRRSAIKQVASGRFGVTIHYLVNADELQIKMAQGAKPGEGGQLPGHKVDKYIGWIRHSTPGVGLISPPPHHDIYSIEDLKQLIYDLRCANPKARVSVKLVSEVGVGTVAAGVAKANADHVLISGHDGGTGASPLSSIQSAGVPWEIGLAETQQTLLRNDLRSRIIVQTDGQLKTGRDVAIAAMLGADEMGFSTAPLIATGCIMMRACHLNTCPVGIATQDPELRKRFQGAPEHVVNFFFFVAEELREIMASLGIRKVDDLIGRVDLLEADGAIDHWKARGVDLTHVLTMPALEEGEPRRQVRGPEPVLDDALDWEIVEQSRAALDDGGRVAPPAADPQRQPLRRRDPLESHRRRARRRGPGGGRHQGRLPRLGRPELRRLACARRDVLAARRHQRLHGQGPVRRHPERPPARRRRLHRRAQRDHRQHRPLRRNGRARVLPRPGRGAVRRAQLRRQRRGRGRRGPRLRVHDGRPRGGPRADRAQLRRGHERRHRLRARRGGRVPGALQHGDGRVRGHGRGRRARAARDGRRAPRADRVTGGASRPRELGRAAARLREGHAARLPPRARRARRAGGRRVQRRRRSRGRPRGGGGERPPARDPRRRGTTRPARGQLMGELGAFLKIERRGVPYRDAHERVGDYKEFLVSRPVPELQEQGARCMECGVPFCHNGCPLGNLIPDWNDLVYRDRWQDAIRQLHATNNFPEFTGRLCPAPCEASCVLEIREGDAVTIKQIENSIIDRAWDEGWVVPEPPLVETGRSAAVIGAGPAGMAAAQQLRRAGHRVVLFERDEAAGGLCRFGVPDFKIEKRIVERRVEQLVAEGVEVRCGVDVGVDVTGDDLRAEFDAVVIATGSRVPRDLPVPGRDLDGIHFAMDYLYVRNRWVATQVGPEPSVAAPAPVEITAAGKHVIVIGGGDTGADCVGNSIREGAESVVQLELLPEPPPTRPDDRTPWPLWPTKFRLSYAMEEAKEIGKGEQDFSIVTTQFTGNGRVEKLHYAQAEAAPPFGPVAGTEGELQGRPRAAGDGLPAPPARGRRRAARSGARPARQRGRGRLRDVGAGRLRRGRRAPRPVADRVGDQRGPPGGEDGRPLPGRAGRSRAGAGRWRRRGRRSRGAAGPGAPRAWRGGVALPRINARVWG